MNDELGFGGVLLGVFGLFWFFVLPVFGVIAVVSWLSANWLPVLQAAVCP